MKKRTIFLVFCLMVAGAFSSKVHAANIAEFEQAGFTVAPASTFEGSRLATFYNGSPLQDKVYVVTDYPKADGKTELNYAPPRNKIEGTEDFVPFENVILSRYRATEESSDLPRILGNWITSGLSSHAIVTLDGTTVYWIDFAQSKGQMGGKWNANSVEVLVATDAGQNIVSNQFEALRTIVAFANTHGEPILHLLSHGEAQGSKEQGTVVNIDEVRTFLKLDNATKEHEQTPFPV